MAAPSAPSSLTITKQLNGDTFDLTAVWTSSTGASGYNLDKSVNGGAFTSVGSDLTGLSITESDISALGSYVYRINAANVDGSSDYTLASINLSYSDIGAVQSGGADIGAVQGSNPVTGAVNVVGGTSGMAPFPVHWYADIEAAGSTWNTGSGDWSEGRSQLRVIDNGTGEVYEPSLSRNAMALTCAISGKVESCFNRISGMPYGSAVIWDAGSYKCQIRYQNRDGNWSAWADSSTITVSADTRTTYYVDGTSGDDGNDGTSWAQAKATLDAGLGLVSAANCKVVVRDDTTVSIANQADLRSYDGVYLTRSFDGTNGPTVTLDHGGDFSALWLGDDNVVDGIRWLGDGVTLRRCYNFVDHASYSANNALLNEHVGADINSYIELGTGSVRGLLIYNNTMGAPVERYMCWLATMSWCSILGCDWQEHSVTEHVIRQITSSNGIEAKWFTIDYGQHSYAGFALGKSALRMYARRFVSVYRTTLAEGMIYFGNHDSSSAASNADEPGGLSH